MNMEIFRNSEFGSIRVIEEDGKYLFCGSDVAKALGYSNPRKAVRDHARGGTKRSIPTASGDQTMTFLPEGDVYRLIVLYYSLARRLSEAETEKDFLRLKKKAGGYEKVLKKLFRSLGLPEDSNAAQDVLEESVIRRHNLVRLEDVEEPQDEGDLEGDEVWSD